MAGRHSLLSVWETLQWGCTALQKLGFKACHSCRGLDPPHGVTDAALVKKNIACLHHHQVVQLAHYLLLE